jgi:hypothetical protein
MDNLKNKDLANSEKVLSEIENINVNVSKNINLLLSEEK